MKILLKITVVFLLLSLNSVFFSQSKFTISGTVSDQASGEGMIGVRIKVSELSGVGTNTNEYGFYSLTLNQGTYALEISSFGYEIKYQTINLNENIILNMELFVPTKQFLYFTPVTAFLI